MEQVAMAQMPKVAISGSGGFIGSHLREALSNRGFWVIPISQALLYSPRELNQFFKREQPIYIFHLASFGNHYNQTDPAMIVFANIIGTFNMLNESKGIDYKKFINFSSSSVLLPIETFYSASKAAAERLAEAFYMQLGKPILTVRPFSIYGEGEADFRFIPTIIKHLFNGEKMVVSENASHDWVYILDFIDTLIAKLNDKGIVNMGTGKSYSNIEIVRILEKISKKKLQYTAPLMKLRDYDTNRWESPDKTIISNIEEGLRKTYGYYKQRFEEKNN